MLSHCTNTPAAVFQNQSFLLFRKLSLNDTAVLRPYLDKKTGKACNFTIGQLLMWRDFLDTRIAEKNGQLFIHAISEGFPTLVIPDMELDDSYFDAADAWFAQNKQVPAYFCYDEANYEKLLKRYPNMQIKEEDYAFDYIYDYAQFMAYPGKLMSKQRNHIHKFDRLYPNAKMHWITESNVSEVQQFFLQHNQATDLTDPMAKEEADKCTEVLSHMKEYGMPGMYMESDGRILAFSIGEVIHDVLYVQIEKADYTADGAYQKMACEFAKAMHTDKTKWINREEDVGDEGIRRSKQSYHPSLMLKKYSLRP